MLEKMLEKMLNEAVWKRYAREALFFFTLQPALSLTDATIISQHLPNLLLAGRIRLRCGVRLLAIRNQISALAKRAIRLKFY